MKDLLLNVHVVVKTLFWKFYAALWQTTSKNATKVRAARAGRLHFLIYPIRSLFPDVVVAVADAIAVVLA